MLKIAIQAKGRLNEESLEMLARSGITVSGGKRKLLAKADGFPMEVLLLRDDDIPQAVASGVADLGIVGQNEVEERMQNVRTIMPLGFGRCHLSLAVPKSADYAHIAWFNGKRVATSYPGILSRYFAARGVNAGICRIEGSVEIAPSIGMADAIFDIVSSGATLKSNGLIEVESVLESEAVLIANRQLCAEKLEELDRLIFRFNSVIESRGKKYVLMNLPTSRLSEALPLIPGMRSPTVLPLAQEGWSSLHAVIDSDKLWDVIHRLKAIGAEGILVLSLENMVK